MSAVPAIEARFALPYPGFELNVDLRLPAAGVSALFGPSGSGKTLCLRCFAGLEPGCDGRIVVGGEVWQDSAGARFVPPHRRPVGFVFQDARLFPHLTVAGNLHYAMRRASGAEAVGFDEAVRLLDIGDLLQRHTERLSGGERQRCAIARALLTRPRLLLLDEPLAALDEARKAELLPYLERLRDALSIPMLYVSHSMREVTRLADHLVLLERGRVQASGPVDEVTTRVDLSFSDDDEAGVVLIAQCAAHEAEFDLTRVRFDGGALWLPRVHCEIGQALRVRVAASDVSVTLEPARASSILNVLPATVSARRDDAKGRSLIQLDVGGSRLLARVTRYSASLLDLRPGQPVYAQVKGAAVLR
ncbi:MAG TPA: molybdenum ABC transporter ATP-binding protein [Burkholderiaceae bacterium]|jgi:molybdate transport system ATP-binding protein|nr:molybdenum ABC transporter ATP-binding protein [Burkholderiaceae bacterium]